MASTKLLEGLQNRNIAGSFSVGRGGQCIPSRRCFAHGGNETRVDDTVFWCGSPWEERVRKEGIKKRKSSLVDAVTRQIFRMDTRPPGPPWMGSGGKGGESIFANFRNEGARFAPGKKESGRPATGFVH